MKKENIKKRKKALIYRLTTWQSLKYICIRLLMKKTLLIMIVIQIPWKKKTRKIKLKRSQSLLLVLIPLRFRKSILKNNIQKIKKLWVNFENCNFNKISTTFCYSIFPIFSLSLLPVY